MRFYIGNFNMHCHFDIVTVNGTETDKDGSDCRDEAHAMSIAIGIAREIIAETGVKGYIDLSSYIVVRSARGINNIMFEDAVSLTRAVH